MPSPLGPSLSFIGVLVTPLCNPPCLLPNLIYFFVGTVECPPEDVAHVFTALSRWNPRGHSCPTFLWL